MKPATSLQQLETRVKSLAKNFSKGRAEALDGSTHGWSFCAVGLKLKEIGIDIDVAKKNGCLGSNIVRNVCGEVLKERGSSFNHNLYSKKGLVEALNFIKYLRNASTCELLR